jgi:hypothetical protein
VQSLSISRSAALALTTLLGLVDRASGAPLTFYFEGHITRIHDSLEFDESVYAGAQFTGSYTFDPVGVSDAFPGNPQVGSYYFGPSGRMSAQIGNYEFVTPDLGVLIWNDVLQEDLYEPVTTTSFTAAGYEWGGMSLALSDLSGMALDTDALPLGVPDLADFPDGRFLVIDVPWNDVGIGGRLTSLTPEPGSLGLLALGAIAVCRRKGRR